jgi:hypothetical protein
MKFEHMFGIWDRLAGDAHREIEVRPKAVNEGFSPAAQAAVAALQDEIAKSVGPRTSDWAVTRWLITKQPIRECVRLEVAERRP